MEFRYYDSGELNEDTMYLYLYFDKVRQAKLFKSNDWFTRDDYPIKLCRGIGEYWFTNLYMPVKATSVPLFALTEPVRVSHKESGNLGYLKPVYQSDKDFGFVKWDNVFHDKKSHYCWTELDSLNFVTIE